MKTEYYLVYRTSKGDEDSANEAVLLGALSPEQLDDLETAINVNNAEDATGEFVCIKEQGYNPRTKEKLDDLTFVHLWNHHRDSDDPIWSNQVLSHLKKRYRQWDVNADVNAEESTVWDLMTAKPHPPEHYVSRTIEEVQRTVRVIRSILKCSDADGCDNGAMMDYALRLISLYERWMSLSGTYRGFTFLEIALYFCRCLAFVKDDCPVEKTLTLLKTLNPQEKKWIRVREQEDSSQKESYELTDLGRTRAAGSINSLFLNTTLSEYSPNTIREESGADESLVEADTATISPQENIPDFENEGAFVSRKIFASLTGYPEETLQDYCENRRGVQWLNEERTIGKNKLGHFFKKNGNQHNSPNVFWSSNDGTKWPIKRKGS